MARNKPEFIIVHHTAVSYDKNPDQYEATKRYHIQKGWGDIGYHYEISKFGKVYKGRAEGAVGAHCYQQNMNYRSIGVALDGNFDQELPTKEQEESLTALLKDIQKRWNIPINKIVPHRTFAPKSCYGTKLSDTWAQELLVGKYDSEFAKKWEGKFILDVDDNGKVYYIFNGKRVYVNPNENMRKFVVDRGLVTGFKNEDVLRIPDGD